LHEFKATFVPDQADLQSDLPQNNVASAATFVAGPGVVLVVEPEGDELPAASLVEALANAHVAVRRIASPDFPLRLPQLLDVDCVVLANIDSSLLSPVQQDMLVRYVRDLGGGLVMVGGSNSFGAGGWINSPVADILPVDLDPPQKKQLPQGALVLVIDRSGSMSGEKLRLCKRAAIGAINTLSKLDEAGVIMFDTVAEWVVPLAKADDKAEIDRKIRAVPEGGGTDMHPAMAKAIEALKKRKGIRHVILLTDGQTNNPGDCQQDAADMKKAGITCSTVAVGPDADRPLLAGIATLTGGTPYKATDPSQVPQIFIKEAQIVRRSLIQESEAGFAVARASSISEVAPGTEAVPTVNGYVLTGAKSGLAQTVLATPDKDPILATGPAGLGRVVAFTSSADARWAKSWVAWGGYPRFWEQTIRWASKAGQPGDCEILTEVAGRAIMVTIESAEADGKIVPIGNLAAQVIDPEMASTPLSLQQVGPGQIRPARSFASGSACFASRSGG
jgi:Ca-activated chloride channel family protein